MRCAGVDDDGDVLQREGLGRVRIEARQEAADQLRFVRRRVARGIERQRACVLAAASSSPPLVVLDPLR